MLVYKQISKRYLVCLLISFAVDRIHHACTLSKQTLHHVTAHFVRACVRAYVCVYFSICELLAQRIDHMLKSIALRLNIHIITSGELCVQTKRSKHTQLGKRLESEA